MNAIEVRDVFRVHSTPEGDAAALQGLSLALREHEVVTVLGPSGAGKSTLLRLLAGVERPSAGAVRVLGDDLAKLPARRLAEYRATQLGYVDQHYARALAPEPRLLVIAPWDKQVIPAIERAILKSDLGLNPASDGSVIRLPVPQLTEETRRNLIKLVHKRIEEGKVAVRNIRREAIEHLRAFKKDGDVAEDDEKRTEDQVQKQTDRCIHDLDHLQKAKEAELLEV